jgi:acyl-coenzyme A synthetase/AMP-(fatty) acid ligase/acetyltransferase-like isoleucine patch superfamily enzyme
MAPRQVSSSQSLDGLSTSEASILAATRHLLKPNGSILGSAVFKVIEPLFPTFVSAIPTHLASRPALGSIDGRAPINHARIHDFVTTEFGPALHAYGFGRGDRIALVLPNGPELALAIAATLQWASCVPLSANGAASELEADLMRAGVDLIVGPYAGAMHKEGTIGTDERFHVMDADSDWSVFASIERTAARLGIPFLGLVPSPIDAGIFKLVVPSRVTGPIKFSTVHRLLPLRSNNKVSKLPNTADSEVLVLFTSGTTGNKKLVPHLLMDMLTAATMIALSWDLTEHDVNCNLMPLFHVGGIVRQVFSPLISGGCVICCPSFDPSVFWALLVKRAFTWYYAAPTMHQLILQTGHMEADDSTHTLVHQIQQPALRMIANAAGGLLPSLAVQLRETFGATVLPSYGMTECMPISSPPPTYQLGKPGTSGVAVGPEISILNTVTIESLPAGEEGPICVRGEPCFRGYGKIANDPADTAGAETFMKDGWFNTGDIGYLDEDGYLFITGRSKEVINRGGEIISPMEVEEAVVGHPDILECAAFSAAHDLLQEVVGVVLVMARDRPRLDLPSLHEFLGERIAAPKWPQCLVFLDGLPKSHTNKLLRVKLGSRFGLPELSDEMPPIHRTFEGKCPPQGTQLEDPIPISLVAISPSDVRRILVSHLVTRDDQLLFITPHPARAGSLVCHTWNIDRVKAIESAREFLDRYLVPSHFVVLKQRVMSEKELAAPLYTDATLSIMQKLVSTASVDPLVQAVQDIFSDLLFLDYVPGPDANFFHLGGSSLLASQLASKIRKRFDVGCSGAEVFHHATPNEMAKLIGQRVQDSDTASNTDSSLGNKSLDNHSAPFPAFRLPPQSSFFASAFQLVPIFLLIPFWQVTRYLLFFSFVLRSIDVVPGDRDIMTFIAAYLAFHLCWVTIAPLVFVAIKWIVIGRYREGRYAIWSNYYLRWWFVDVCRKLFLRGIWGSNEYLLNFYYRLLGAKIGAGSKISLEAEIAEFDLVTVGRNGAVEQSIMRGFGVDNGAMILGPVSVGAGASVGARSVVAPFTSVPDGAHLGPVTSTYEVGKALDARHARVHRRLLPQPSFFMQHAVGGSIAFLVNCFAQIPPLLVLLWMLRYKGMHGEEFTSLSDLMEWLCDPHRALFYIGIRITRAIVSPIFYMVAAIAVKKCVIGKFEAGPRNTWSEWELLRHWLAATLFSRQKIQEVTDIIGRHYELVSVLYRLLGAKVGKRVFWPGHQPVFTGEFELLEVGDDVVFGSRSSIFFATVDSCRKVILCAGSNVADNCVVLPGSILGKNAVLGSNSVCPEGWFLPPGSIWLGSKSGEPDCLNSGSSESLIGGVLSSKIEKEELQLVGDDTTGRPFGRAFYQGKASYFVWPLGAIVLFTVVVKSLIAVFHTLPLLVALQGAGFILFGLSSHHHRHYDSYHYTFSTVYSTVLVMFVLTNFVRVALWLVIELTAKWSLLGKRKAGRYNYDSSSYAQRWEIYQLIAKIRKFNRLNFLEFLGGTPFIASYYRWNGGKIGKDCCLYPAGADPFMPEPDLVIMGDRCVLDCASIVCHLNTRGNFELAEIVIENDCTLRTRSRLQQGCHMEEGAQLLEKSLALTGEVIESNSVWQGGPASWWFQYSKTSIPYAGEKDVVCDESTKLLDISVDAYDV